jgi:hypothetical protein
MGVLARQYVGTGQLGGADLVDRGRAVRRVLSGEEPWMTPGRTDGRLGEAEEVDQADDPTEGPSSDDRVCLIATSESVGWWWG